MCFPKLALTRLWSWSRFEQTGHWFVVLLCESCMTRACIIYWRRVWRISLQLGAMLIWFLCVGSMSAIRWNKFRIVFTQPLAMWSYVNNSRFGAVRKLVAAWVTLPFHYSPIWLEWFSWHSNTHTPKKVKVILSAPMCCRIRAFLICGFSGATMIVYSRSSSIP